MFLRAIKKKKKNGNNNAVNVAAHVCIEHYVFLITHLRSVYTSQTVMKSHDNYSIADTYSPINTYRETAGVDEFFFINIS